MSLEKKIFYTNLAIGSLGLIVGIDNLLRWFYHSDVKGIIIGTICTVFASWWIVITLYFRKTDSEKKTR